MNRTEIVTLVNAMPFDDRVAIATAIYHTVSQGGTAPDTDEETWAELDRRMAAIDADPSRLITLEELKARLASER